MENELESFQVKDFRKGDRSILQIPVRVLFEIAS